MASTIDHQKKQQSSAPTEAPAVVVDADEYEAALEDPRVKDLHERADKLLRQFESDGRNL